MRKFSEIHLNGAGALDPKLKLTVSYEKFIFEIKSNYEKFQEKACPGFIRYY